MYRMSKDEIYKLCQYLDENLAQGFICANCSNAIFLILFVKKHEDD